MNPVLCRKVFNPVVNNTAVVRHHVKYQFNAVRVAAVRKIAVVLVRAKARVHVKVVAHSVVMV